MPCPDDEILLALLEGRLRDAALEETDRHLDGCESCRELVGVLASGVLASGVLASGVLASGALASGVLASGAPAPTPARVGRYALGALLGTGATGAVHAAHDPELDRDVALKRLHASGDARQRARLLREAQALARLSHPNVVTVFDVGLEGDELYVAMELVRGQSLRSWMKGARSEAETLTTLAQAGRGLAAAHARGLVHRDVKPENVLVGADGTVKVVDFGLAHEDAGTLEDDAGVDVSSTLTATGALLGTPAYMAPEQLDHALRGARAPIDARADQFAFAVTAWEALEGQRPFGASRLSELRAAIEACPPSARSMRRSVERALRRALHRHPDARWPSMDALLDALGPGAPRARAIALGGLVAGAVALAGLAWLGATGEAPCQASAQALSSRRDHESEATMLPAIATELDRWASAWTSRRVEVCEATRVRHEQSEALLDARMRCLDEQADRFVAVTRALADDEGGSAAPELLATLEDPARCVRDETVAAPEDARAHAAREALDEASLWLARGEAARALATLEGEEPETLGASLRVMRALLRAEALRTLGRYDDALAAAQAGLFVAEERESARVLAAWIEVLRVLGASGRYSEAGDLLAHAEAARRRREASPEDDEAFLRARASVRTGLGDLRGAREDLDAALAAVTARLGPRALGLASIHASLGNLARLEGRSDDALRDHEAALELDRALLGARHPHVARDLHNVAGILRARGRLDDAESRYEESLSIAIESFGPHHPETALTRNSLGLVAFARHDRARARALWDEALADLEAAAHGDAALVHHNLALLELEEAHADRALAQIRAALALDRDRVGVEAKRVAAEDLVLGRTLVALARPEEAREALLRAEEAAHRLGERELEDEVREALAPLEPTPGEPATVPAATTLGTASPPSRPRPARTRTQPAPTAPTSPSDPEAGPAPEAPAATIEPRALTPDAGPPAVWHPSGSGAYGASVPWE